LFNETVKFTDSIAFFTSKSPCSNSRQCNSNATYPLFFYSRELSVPIYPLLKDDGDFNLLIDAPYSIPHNNSTVDWAISDIPPLQFAVSMTFVVKRLLLGFPCGKK